MVLGIPALPDLNRQSYIICGAIVKSCPHHNRHWNLSPVPDRYNKISLIALYLVDRNINIPGPIEPAPPEPGKIFTRYILHMIKEIVWLRVLVSPGFNVRFESVIKPFLTQYIFPQQ